MENALLGLISKFTENREAAPEAEPAPKPRKQAKQVEQEPQPKLEVENPQASGQDAAAPLEQQAAEPAPAEPAELPAQNKEYTEVDVRAAMDEARKRIEGEDYKTNTESEGRKKWHRALTGWFKNTAALYYGADKPSELPDSESRRKFIELCAEVKVVNDELTTDLPF